MLGVMISPAAVAIAGEAPQRPAPLDAFAGQLYASVGLRRMLASYAGPLIRARRSTDNEQADFFGASDGWVSGADLAAWAGAGSVYIVMIFDQTGNGRHASQGGSTKQPRIVSNGVADVGPNGRPVVRFDGVDDQLDILNSLDFSAGRAAITMAAVASRYGSNNGGSNQQLIFVPSAKTTGGMTRANVGYLTSAGLRIIAGGRRLDDDAYQNVASSEPAVLNAWRRIVARIRYSNAQIEVLSNALLTAGAFQTAGNVQALNGSGNVSIGLTSTGGEPFAGAITGSVIAQSALNAADLDTALAMLLP